MARAIDNDQARGLLTRSAAGDEKALAELHRLLAPWIFRFALHRLRNDRDAEEVVVDTMCEVWKSAAKFEDRSLVSTWVLGIARFKTLALLRKAPQHHEDIDDHEDFTVDDVIEGEAILVAKEEKQQIDHCMTRLSADHRECLQLVYYLDLGLAEVAQRLQVPEGTVKSRLSAARKNLRDCLQNADARSSRH